MAWFARLSRSGRPGGALLGLGARGVSRTRWRCISKSAGDAQRGMSFQVLLEDARPGRRVLLCTVHRNGLYYRQCGRHKLCARDSQRCGIPADGQGSRQTTRTRLARHIATGEDGNDGHHVWKIRLMLLSDCSTSTRGYSMLLFGPRFPSPSVSRSGRTRLGCTVLRRMWKMAVYRAIATLIYHLQMANVWHSWAPLYT